MRTRFIAAFAFFSAIVTSPALADESGVTELLSEADASNLSPGQYEWEPDIAPDGPLRMVVNLPTQRAYVYRDDVLIGISTISSGKRGYRTPTGTFAVLEKERFHRSSKYDDAPMPYMQRLTWSGLALHGENHISGHPASHGCVRLPLSFAAQLFKEATTGMEVVITNQSPDEERVSENARSAAQSGESGSWR